MGFLNWAKNAHVGRRGKPAPGKAIPPTGKGTTRQTPPQQPPSWLADKWNKTKRAGGAAMTLGTGVGLGSMIPLAAGRATETDIERMNSYEPTGSR